MLDYQREHDDSVTKGTDRGRTPRSLSEYLAWFSDRWRAESPTDINSPGVWRGWPDRSGRTSISARQSTPTQLSGGSLLGSPRERDPFRRLIEESPFEVQYGAFDGNQDLVPHYVRPARAAIARISHSRPLIAMWLYTVASSDFDWRSVADRRGLAIEEAEFLLIQALFLLYREFDISPRPRILTTARVRPL